MPYAQVTLAIYDDCPGGLEGFAPLSEQLPAAVFEKATADGEPMSQSGAAHAIFLDLMDAQEMQIGEKCISLAQAAQILGLPADALVPLGRQRLAQINDEDSAYIADALEGRDK